MNHTELISMFKNPSVKYRIKPFWFWNGEMDRAEISRQIQEMAEKGLGGMFICARQGLSVPYLSKEWFDLVEYACEEARRYGIEAWLYDEYPYPSGMSGGEVLLEHPDAEHMTLQHYHKYVDGGEIVEMDLGWSRVLFAKAFPVSEDGQTYWDKGMDLTDYVGVLQTEKIYQQTGLTAYNNKRFFSYGPKKILTVQLPEGSWRVEVYTEAAMGDFKYYGGFFDPCNEKAVQTFIKTTHERYRKAVGEHFGISVHGMFSDEVGLLSDIPWSTKLPAFFEKKNGYSLLECMPALHDDTIKDAVKIRYQMYNTAHELFRDSYHKQVAQWCQDNQLMYATEVPSMRLGTQKYSTVIGGDTGHDKLGKSLDSIYNKEMRNYRCNARAVSSLARQLGRKYAMIESFHSVGWTMTLQDAKWMIDRLGAEGINLYNFHAFYYTIQDITKHDAPPSQFLQNPYWKHYRKLADYVGRMGVLVTETEADIHVAVLDPVAALWTKLGNPFHGFTYAGESEKEKKELEQLRDTWVGLCKSLISHQIGYDHLDVEMLTEATVEDGCIHLGNATYSVIVMPPCHCMEAGAREKLKEFVASGGKLVGFGELPYISIDNEETDETTKEQWRDLFQMDGAEYLEHRDEEKVAEICRNYGKAATQIQVIEGNPKDVLSSIRRGDGYIYTFVANQGGDNVIAQIQANNRCLVEQLDLESGAVEPAKVEWKDENAFTIGLEGYASRWLRWKAENHDLKDQSLMAVPVGENGELTIPMQGQWKITPAKKNICRFARVEMSLDGKQWTQVDVKTFIEQCATLRLLEKEKLGYSGLFGTPKKITPLYPMDCWYRMEFYVKEPVTDVSILLDKGTVEGQHEIYINETCIPADAFYPVWVDDCSNCEASVGQYLKSGKNELLIHVNVAKDEDGLRDPLYLRGSFGVEKQDGMMCLTKMPEAACPDEPWCEGMPYYSGDMTYERGFDRQELVGTLNEGGEELLEVRLGFSVPKYECQELRINGESLGVKAYTPYIWKCDRSLLKEKENKIEVVVTNTLANMLDGTYFDYEKHQLVEI